MPTWKDYPPPSRPVAMSVDGMVAAAHPLAAAAGVKVLADGGNAFDAAVATAATLNVVEPFMSGVGGIGIALVYQAGENRVRALNFSGRAARAATPDRFDAETKSTGILSALVPGNVAGWMALHETYGSMERERLFAPAIGYAEDGFPVSRWSSRIMCGMAGRLGAFASSADIILDAAGNGPRPGARLVMPQLAASFRAIVRDGAETFYRGELAARIIAGVEALDGILTAADLNDYQAEWMEPISTTYRGHELFTHPPNSSAFQVLQTLNLMETYAAAELAWQEPATLHRFMEAIKLCVTDRIEYGGDPDYVQAPLSGLLSKEYAAAQRRRIDPDRAAVVRGEHYASDFPGGSLTPGDSQAFDGGMTTHFATADRDGNVVTVTQTLGGGFGSAVAAGDTGIFLNNMGSWFDLEEGSPNRIGPGRRVDFVVAPTQVFRDGRFLLSMGTPGSWGILQTTPQMLLNALEYGMNVQQAIEAPRFRCITGRQVTMEERFPAEIRQAITRYGHEVQVIEPWSPAVGGAQAIAANGEQGIFEGGADPRRDGFAFGL